MTKKQKANVNKYQQKKLQTKLGLAQRMFYDARRRVTSPRHPVSGPYYKNLAIASKEEFINHCLNSNSFNELYKMWKLSGFSRPLRPTPNRINTKVGYVPSNIDFLPLVLNKRNADKLIGTENIAPLMWYCAGHVDEAFGVGTAFKKPYLLLATTKFVLRTGGF